MRLRGVRDRGWSARKYAQVGDTGCQFKHFTIGREWLVGQGQGPVHREELRHIHIPASLEAGEYRFFYNFLKAGAVDCGVSSEQEKELKVIVTVQ